METKKKILIVEDEKNIAQVLQYNIIKSGYDAEIAGDGGSGLVRALSGEFDLVLLDIMLPVMNGFEVCEQIRLKSQIPIIFVTAREEEKDKILGLDTGADDYVTKPFSPKEVMARIGAVTKRANAKDEPNGVERFDGLEVDMVGRNVYVDGVKAELTPKEYELLFYLVRNKGIALTREKLLYDVWGFDFYGDDRTVDTHIKMLRGNLKEYRRFIVTLRGLGYKFEP